MASLIIGETGLARILIKCPDGKRRTLRLERVPERDAQLVAGHVAHLNNAITYGTAVPPETMTWVSRLGDAPRGRLAGVGLVESRKAATLGVFLDRIKQTMTAKGSTKVFYSHTCRNLREFFGAAKPMRSISPADADSWRAWLVSNQKLSPATVARRVVAARTMWRKALRWRLVSENPFAGVRAGSQANEGRKVFVPRTVVDAVMRATTDLEWKAIISLARYAGLRTPSETYALRWSDISWDAGTMLVRCPKLEHHERYSQRLVPLFPEVRDVLLKLFAEAPDGTDDVIVRNRLASCNLRTTFTKLIARAGQKPWPRLFHNLRASRETELMREYDLATVCRWIGNSPEVAAKHYATSIDLDADFQRAAGLCQSATSDNGIRQATQKAAHDQREADQNNAHDEHDADAEMPENAAKTDDALCCASSSDGGMGPVGLEPTTRRL